MNVVSEEHLERQRQEHNEETGSSRVLWKPVLGTRNWSLEDETRGLVVRQLLVHDCGVPEGPRFEVIGEGYGSSVHATFYEAKAAAEASL